MFNRSREEAHRDGTLSYSGPIPTTKLTVYSQSGHIIQTYSVGTKTVTLPKSAEVSSIVIIDNLGNIIPFTYIPETNTTIALTDRITGNKTEVTILKDNKSLSGKLLSFDAKNAVISVDDQIICINRYDYLTINNSGDYTRPRLVLDRDTQAFTISYLLSSIAWNCVGTALITNDKSFMYLRLVGNIVNNTESDIEASTTLVSGEVNQNRPEDNFLMAVDARASSFQSYAKRSPAPVKTSLLEDYIKYDIGLRNIHSKDIAELGTWKIPIMKIYSHNTESDNIVKFGYRFKTPKFIPTCSVNVYSMDEKQIINSYLGSDNISESQINKEVDIILGETTIMDCSTLIIISEIPVSNEEDAKKYNIPLDTFAKKYRPNDRKEWRIITEDISVKINNRNTVNSLLILRHYVGTKLLTNISCKTYNKRENGFIEWYFQIPEGTMNDPHKEEFVCQITTASYY